MTGHVGIDIGATGIRVVQTSGLDEQGKLVVSRAAFGALPPGAVVVGEVKKEAIVANVLADTLKAAGLSSRGCVVGLSSGQARLFRTTVNSSVPGTHRRMMLRTDPDLAPASLDVGTMALSWVTTGSYTNDDTAVDQLLVAATEREDVERLLTVCDMAKVTVRAVDLSGVALTRAMMRTYPNGREVATLVDIGATQTTVTTRQGSHVRSIRTVPFGGDDITRALMTASGETREAAEQQKRWLRIPDTGKTVQSAEEHFGATAGGYGDLPDDVGVDPQTLKEEALAEAARTIIEQIEASVETDRETYQGITSGVFLTGGSANVRGLPELLERRIGIPCVPVRPWMTMADKRRNRDYFATDPVTGERRPDPQALKTYACAAGLSHWGKK